MTETVERVDVPHLEDGTFRSGWQACTWNASIHAVPIKTL